MPQRAETLLHDATIFKCKIQFLLGPFAFKAEFTAQYKIFHLSTYSGKIN